MAEILAAPRRLKSELENKKDFYQTPPACTRALIDFFKNDIKLNPNLSVLDPCAGELAITKELEKFFPQVDVMDKYMDYSGEDFLKTDKSWDIIIANVPYSDKYNFLNKALEVGEKVFAILPQQINNYNVFHKEYMDRPDFVGKLVMTPKIMMHEGQKIVKGGTSSYAWFFWDKHHDRNYSLEWYKNLDNFKE